MDSPHKGQWRGALVCFFYLRLDKRFSTQFTRRWFKTPSFSSWRQYNDLNYDTTHVEQLDSASFKTACDVCIILHDHVVIKWNRQLYMAFKIHEYNHTYPGRALNHQITEEWSLTTWPLAWSLNSMFADELVSQWINTHKINLAFPEYSNFSTKGSLKSCTCSKMLHIPWSCGPWVRRGPMCVSEYGRILSGVLSYESCQAPFQARTGNYNRLREASLSDKK